MALSKRNRSSGLAAGNPAPLAGDTAAYRLDRQVGFLLRRANQRHLAIFAKAIPDLTPRQFAALAKLGEAGPLSQNRLGRATAMDAATVKGVVARLSARGLVEASADPDDRRRLIVGLTDAGRRRLPALLPAAREITAATLAPLTEAERNSFLRLLERLA